MRLKMRKPNIIFIVIDALRPRNLGCYGYARPTSPNIDKLSEEGLIFRDVYSCTNATDPSLTTIFSGKPPRSHGIMKHGALLQSEEVQNYLKTVHTLPEILKHNGYKTFAIDWLGRWHIRGYDYYSGILRPVVQWGKQRLTYGKTRDYELNEVKLTPIKYLSLALSKFSAHIKPPSITPRTDIYGDATIVTRKALEIIKENLGQNFFLFVHYWDTHFPYNSPASDAKERDLPSRSFEKQLERAKHRGRKKQIKSLGGIEKVLAMYDGAISFIDQEIGHLISSLKEWGILENTLVILTADHGESLTEHGIYFDHHGLYQVTLHVPLIFKYAGLPRGKVVTGFVQHPDIAPTILDILEIESGEDFDGKSMIPLIYQNKKLNQAVYAEEMHSETKQMVATYKYKYIRASSKQDAVCKYCHTIHGGIEELYDLENDPEETSNVILDHPDEASQLRDLLTEWLKNAESKRERLKLKGHIQSLKRDNRI